MSAEKVVIVSDDIELSRREKIIERGLRSFVEVGRALMEIRDKRLYESRYSTFEVYCRERWSLSRPYAYQLMDGSKVARNVSAIADIQPVTESQARPLTKLKDAEQQREAWAEAVETAPAGKVTARHVAKVVRSRTEKQTTNPIDFEAGRTGRVLASIARSVIDLDSLRATGGLERFAASCGEAHRYVGQLDAGAEVLRRAREVFEGEKSS